MDGSRVKFLFLVIAPVLVLVNSQAVIDNTALVPDGEAASVNALIPDSQNGITSQRSMATVRPVIERSDSYNVNGRNSGGIYGNSYPYGNSYQYGNSYGYNSGYNYNYPTPSYNYQPSYQQTNPLFNSGYYGGSPYNYYGYSNNYYPSQKYPPPPPPPPPPRPHHKKYYVPPPPPPPSKGKGGWYPPPPPPPPPPPYYGKGNGWYGK